MAETTTAGDLPTPVQMAALLAATQAARQARRMREASRAIVTGNIALGVCLFGVVLVLMHAERGGSATPLVACGLVYGYLAWLVVSRRWASRRRAGSVVTVVDQREEALRAAVSTPWKTAVVVFVALAVQAVFAAGWVIAFRHMSNTAILASLSVGPLLGASYFVLRFVQFQFWEDLLFAGCVALAFAPFFLQAWYLAPLSYASLALAVLGAASLHARWVAWTRALTAEAGEGVPQGRES
jgi:hypothetical protein